MSNRRSFMIGMAATGLCPQTIWAEAGNPSFISAALKPNGLHVLCGLTGQGQIVFTLPLPARGHAGAVHPQKAEAVIFARRPGMFAFVMNCVTGQRTTHLHSPQGRHFNGHGTFSPDGNLLFTTENDYENANGIIGVWSTQKGYRRIGEFFSRGIGPHDVKLLSDGNTLVVANGGIETHPETGRAKLNIPVMRPNLAYLSLDGQPIDIAELDPSLNKNSIRHLDVTSEGVTAFATQWQGNITDLPPLLGFHMRGQAAQFIQAPDPMTRRMRGYVGSIALSKNMSLAAVTSPKGGICQLFDIRTGILSQELMMDDVCGIAPYEDGFVLTSGTGFITWVTAGGIRTKKYPVYWDNHLTVVSA